MNNAAIGIFDSGVGGLTVAKAVRAELPDESIIYFGDSIHLPYGNKSPSAILQYSFANMRFLCSLGVKIVIVACNTSTAVALTKLQAASSVPVIGVINPGAQAAVTATKNGKIGIVGTSRTVLSRAYTKSIQTICRGSNFNEKKIVVYEKACPLFVPIVEENFKNKKIIEQIVYEYMRELASKTDTIVLGCTHYPLIRPVISRVFPRIRLIDSARSTASAAASFLRQNNLTKKKDGNTKLHIYTNDINEVFKKISHRLFPREKILFKEP